MEKLASSLKKGLRAGVETTWMLVKITLPVYLAVFFLGHTPVLEHLARLLEPAMRVFRLPGEAALVLVIGNALGLFAAIGAMKAVSLTADQVTTLALMLSFSHNLFVETAVVGKMGLGTGRILTVRLLLMVVSGLGCAAVLG